MKVLLINPNSSLIDKSWAYKKFFTPIAPLGLAYIAGVLKKEGIGVAIFDQFGNKLADAELIDKIKKEKPDIVGFSVLTPVAADVERLAMHIRQISKNTTIVLGNLHATCFPEELIKEGFADIVVRGEGELTMLEICRRLGKNKDLGGLPGVSFKKDGKIIHNLDRDPINDLDSLPFPAWELLDLDNYTEVPLASINKARAFPILASRGCTYRCYYCSQDKLYNKVRYRKLSRVVDEMEYLNDKLNIKFFGFSDAYFPFDENSGLEFCNLVIGRKLNRKLKWCTETRVDKVTPKLLRAMKEAGAHLIMYGIEVGNEDILNTLHKGTTLEQAKTAVAETRKAGILSQGLFILGLPGETKETCIETINFAKRLDCDIVKFNIAMPYPGSRFYKDYKELKAMHNPERFTSWFDWTNASGNLVYTPEAIDSNTLRYLQRKAMFEFYVRPKVILRHLFKGTITLKNILYGGLWLISLLCKFNSKNKLSTSPGKSSDAS